MIHKDDKQQQRVKKHSKINIRGSLAEKRHEFCFTHNKFK